MTPWCRTREAGTPDETRRTRPDKTTRPVGVVVVFQVVQVCGSLLILAGFVASQRGWVDPKAWSYLWLNLIGSGILAVQAAMEQQWGFLLLEGVWAIVSALGMVTKVRTVRAG